MFGGGSDKRINKYQLSKLKIKWWWQKDIPSVAMIVTYCQQEWLLLLLLLCCHSLLAVTKQVHYDMMLQTQLFLSKNWLVIYNVVKDATNAPAKL